MKTFRGEAPGEADDAGGDAGDGPPLASCNVGHTGRLTGTLFTLNGTLPLPGVTVYVAGADPGPLAAGPELLALRRGAGGEPADGDADRCRRAVLARRRAEGDLPHTAMATSNEALDCVLPFIGVDLAEVTSNPGSGASLLFAEPAMFATAERTASPGCSPATAWC